MRTTALFAGRFQPFHNGHLDAIKKILKENDRVIIVIGSAEKSFLPDNPLTAGERIQLVEESLKEAKIPAEKYLIIPLNDLNSYALWLDYVNTYIPPYEKFYTGSKLIKHLYEKQVKIVDVKKVLKINATIVREQILKNGKWENLVPQAVSKLLKKWGIPERLKKIS